MVNDSDRTGTSEEVLVEVAGHEDVEGLAVLWFGCVQVAIPAW